MAVAVNIESNHKCNIINVESLLKYKNMDPSNYTSHGKKKCVAGEPIRTQEDIIRISSYFANNPNPKLAIRNVTLFKVGISIGIRGNDLLRLRIRDVIDRDDNIADELLVFESKTNKMNHPFVNKAAKEALTAYLDFLGNYDPDDFLFCGKGRNTPMKTCNLYALLHNAEKDLGLDYRLTVRSLRKTFAYWTIKLHPDNVNIMASLQEMLNHNDMKTTLHYSGHAKENMKTMYNDIANVFDGNKMLDANISPKFESKLDKILAILSEDDDE